VEAARSGWARKASSAACSDGPSARASTAVRAARVLMQGMRRRGAVARGRDPPAGGARPVLMSRGIGHSLRQRRRANGRATAPARRGPTANPSRAASSPANSEPADRLYCGARPGLKVVRKWSNLTRCANFVP